MNTLKTSFDRSIYESPLQNRQIGIWILVLLICLGLGGILGNVIRLGQEFYGDSPLDEFRIYFTALGVALLAALPAVLILYWLSRRKPEAWWIYALALLWGGICGTGWVITLHFFISVPDLLMVISGETIRENQLALSLAGALDAGLIEELTKAVGLLLLVWLLRSAIHGMRDGFVYGALVGLGFNIMECSIYIMMIYHENGVPPYLSQSIVRYCFLGLDGHALYTGLVGLGIGFAIQARRQPARLLVPLLFFTLAVLAHATWDTLPIISRVITTMMEPAAASHVEQPVNAKEPKELDVEPNLAGAISMWSGLVILTLVTQWPFMALAVAMVRQSGKWELRVLRDELAGEVETGVVTAAEYALIQSGRLPAWWSTARRIYNCQACLAMRKQHLRQAGQVLQPDPLLQSWRDEITRLRAAAGALA